MIKHLSAIIGTLVATTTAGLSADLDRVLYGAEPVAYAKQRSAPSFGSPIQGYLQGGYANISSDEADAEADSWSLRGALNVHAGEGVNFQVDGGYTRISLDPVDFDLLNGGFHAYFRPGQSYAVGAFVQGGQLSTGIFDDIGLGGVDDTATDYVIGGEAAYFTDLATLHGRAGFGRASWSEYDADHWLGAVGARLYATDNVRFDAEAGFNRFEAYGGTVDIYSLALRGNYRPNRMPFSMFAGYRFDHTEVAYADTTLGEAETHNIFGGLRLHFGSSSLKDEERAGPVWSTNGLLP